MKHISHKYIISIMISLSLVYTSIGHSFAQGYLAATGDTEIGSSSVVSDLINVGKGGTVPDLPPKQNAKLMEDLKRMWWMFEAYQEMLSPYGKRMRDSINIIIKPTDLQKDEWSVNEALFPEAGRIVSIMPDPHHIDIEKYGALNWFNWFDPDKIKTSSRTFGSGCIWPCQHCLRGNGRFQTRCKPLPVVISMIMDTMEERTYFSGWDSNNVLDWCDPFFGVYLDGLCEFVKRKNPKKIIFGMTIAGWDKSDNPHAQLAAEWTAKLLSAGKTEGGFTLSFHMGRPGKYDVIRAIYENNGKVPEEIIELYADYYANIINTLGCSLKKVYLYEIFKPTSLNAATKEVFRRTLQKIGIVNNVIENIMLSFEKGHRFPCVDVDDRFMLVWGWIKVDGTMREEKRSGFGKDPDSIPGYGRGTDFFRRVEAAEKGDSSCLTIDREAITDNHLPLKDFPEVIITHSGRVKVKSIEKPGKTLIRSTLDRLIPLREESIQKPPADLNKIEIKAAVGFNRLVRGSN